MCIYMYTYTDARYQTSVDKIYVESSWSSEINKVKKIMLTY